MNNLRPPRTYTLIKALPFVALALLTIPASARGARHRAVVHHRVARHIVRSADPSIAPLVGLWYVTKDSKEDRSMKVRLNADGTFLFAGTTYKSEGTYSVKDGKLALEWTEVDGQHVKPGTMHKLLALTADMCSFTIDRYTYGKHVDVVAAQN